MKVVYDQSQLVLHLAQDNEYRYDLLKQQTAELLLFVQPTLVTHFLIKQVHVSKLEKNTLTSQRANADKGVSSAGLTTTVHPAASAAHAFLVIMAFGKFH